jgi:DNA-directed RNA polymerase beta subunit
VGSRVTGDDIIIGKIAKLDIMDNLDLGKKTHKDCSMALRRSENGIID